MQNLIKKIQMNSFSNGKRLTHRKQIYRYQMGKGGEELVKRLGLKYTQYYMLEKEMATPSSVLAWRIPGTGEPSGLPSMGSHRVGHE